MNNEEKARVYLAGARANEGNEFNLIQKILKDAGVSEDIITAVKEDIDNKAEAEKEEAIKNKRLQDAQNKIVDGIMEIASIINNDEDLLKNKEFKEIVRKLMKQITVDSMNNVSDSRHGFDIISMLFQ